MKYIVTSQKMKQIDKKMIEQIGIPSFVLMERAALGVTGWLFQKHNVEKCLIVVGTGNNGADGLAVARQLLERNKKPEIYICGTVDKGTKEFKIQYEILKNLNATFISTLEEKNYTVIVDGIFGVGLSREVEGIYKEAISFINSNICPIVSIDIPSGIDGTTGKMYGCAVKATETVTFGFWKRGLLFLDGILCAGQVILEGAGFHECELFEKEKESFFLEKKDLATILPKRSQLGNKGNFGKVLVIAGGNDMGGAAFLSAYAAYKSGCGMVKVCTGEKNRTSLMSLLPEVLLSTWKTEDEGLSLVKEQLEWADIVAFGSGMGQTKLTEQLTIYLLEYCSKPLVIDADGLNTLSKYMDKLKKRQYPCILTPHLMEFSRLIQKPLQEWKENVWEEVKQFVETYPVICVAKDARTIVAKKGETAYINRSGNSGMATAGSGDVLAGMISGFLAQGVEPKMAAILGVYVHGLCGDYGKTAIGEYSLMAKNIIEYLPDVLGGKTNE